jgi:outer membrane autotransporter protein
LLDGGYTFKAGKKLRITPIASLQYLRLHLDGYTETNAGALNLAVNSQSYDMLQSGLGMKLDRSFEVNYGTIIPEIHAKWLYDFINDKQETTSTFSGGGGSFATNGFTPARSALDIGGRLALVTKGNWSFDANYDFEYKEDFTSHTGWADIRYQF